MSSIDHALQTLVLLGERGRLGVSDLAEALGVASSTAHRTLTALCRRQFAQQDPSSRLYSLGSAVTTLARSVGSRRELVPTARPALERLGIATGETINLIALRGVDAVFLDGIEGRQTIRVATRIGDHIPAHSSAGGKALMASFSAERLRRQYGETPLARVTDNTITDLAQLADDLQKVRERGFALNSGEGFPGVHAVGVAIPGPDGEAIAAVTIALPSTRFDESSVERLAALLRDTAEEIGAELASGSTQRPREGSR